MRLAEPAWLGLLTFAPLPWLWLRRRPRVAWPTLDGFCQGPDGGRRGWHVIDPGDTQGRGDCLPLVLGLRGRKSRAGRYGSLAEALRSSPIVDRSSSMKAADFPDRRCHRFPGSRRPSGHSTDSSKERSDDLVGLVSFANYPDLVAAPTLDQRFLD